MRKALAPTKRSNAGPSQRVKAAIRLLASGECRTITAAAARVAMSRERLSKAINAPTGQTYLASQRRELISAGSMRAAQRIVDLIDSQSDHVSFDAAKHVLAIEGVRPPERSPVNVDVNMPVGYVICLKNRDEEEEQGQVIEHDPTQTAREA